MQKICGVYKITNTITGDFYIGSSNNVKRRWTEHKKPSTRKRFPNNQLYKDMQKYGIENFVFEVIEEAEESFLKEKEQQFIETLKPTYNNYMAKGWNIERRKETCRKYSKEYRKTDKCKDYQKKYQKEYQKTDKLKKYCKEYKKSKKYKKHQKEYHDQLCCYNGETLTLNALSKRFLRQGIPHPTIEAKKYLLNK